MKKFIISLLIICGIMAWASISIVESTKKGTLFKVNIAEYKHSISNAPLFVAINRNYFVSEGINVNIIVKPSNKEMIDSINADDIQIGICEPVVATYIHDINKRDSIVSFSQFSNLQNTLLIAKRTYVTENYNFIKKLIKGINKGIDFINNNNSDIVSENLFLFFPDISKEELIKMIEYYKKQNIWDNYLKLMNKTL